MHALARSFIERVRAGLSQTRNLGQLAGWVERNTRHPKDPARHWSFDEHEFQRQILSDSANDQVVKKCAQVGLSEVSLRMALGLIDIFPQSTAIYTLPTATFATTFVRTRFDPVIEHSPELREKLHGDIDNASLKRIGNSFLYIRGTFSKAAAISVPADILIHDEVDFSNQEVLSSYTSRLGHVKEEDIVKRRFSTPTLSGYGVSSLFDESTQNWYAVKCHKCGTWQVPQFMDHVVIPGYERPLKDFDKDDLTDPRYKIDEAYLACPRCRQALTTANLSDPQSRQWVAARPGQTRSGYQVQPFDVPTINTVPRILRGVADYERKADWVNFRIGQDYQDADTSFLPDALERGFKGPWVQPVPGAAHGCVMGIDVGKTSWVVIGRSNGKGLDVLHYERIKLTTKEALPERAGQLARCYGVVMTVVDAAPEWTQAIAVIDKIGRGFASYYSNQRKPSMSFVEPDEEKRVVSVDRTGLISDVAARVNNLEYTFADAPDKATFQAHLGNIKKVRKPDSSGDIKDSWINTGPDHYGHALFFASAAKHLLNYRPKDAAVPAVPMAALARVGLGEQREHLQFLRAKG